MPSNRKFVRPTAVSTLPWSSLEMILSFPAKLSPPIIFVLKDKTKTNRRPRCPTQNANSDLFKNRHAQWPTKGCKQWLLKKTAAHRPVQKVQTVIVRTACRPQGPTKSANEYFQKCCRWQAPTQSAHGDFSNKKKYRPTKSANGDSTNKNAARRALQKVQTVICLKWCCPRALHKLQTMIFKKQMPHASPIYTTEQLLFKTTMKG